MITMRWLLRAAYRWHERPQLTERWREAGDGEDDPNGGDSTTNDGHDWSKELRGHTRLQAAKLIRGAGKDALDGGDTPPHGVGRGSQREHIAYYHANGI